MRRLCAVLALLTSGSAVACSCGWAGFAAAFSGADTAFEGVVDEDPWEPIALLQLNPYWSPSGFDYVYAVRVTRVFKGHVASRVLVTTEASTCGVYPRKGTTWIFVPREGVATYEIHECDGSTELTRLDVADLAVLGAGKPPRPRTREVLLFAALGIGVPALAIFVRRWKRTPARERG